MREVSLAMPPFLDYIKKETQSYLQATNEDSEKERSTQQGVFELTALYQKP